MPKKLLLIDGNSIAFKAFFALYQSLDRFTNSEGLHTSAIYGFNRMLDKVLAAEQPDEALVAFDAGGKPLLELKNMKVIRAAGLRPPLVNYLNKCRSFGS